MESVRTGHGLGSPFVVEFSAPMDAATVAAALRIEPDAAVSLSWDPSVSVLTIAPVDHWQPDTLYSVTVDAHARAADGGALKAPVRALVLTAAAGSATIAATRPVEQRVRTDTAFLLTFDRDVSVDAVRGALRSEPAIHGDVTATDTPGELLLTPYGPLARRHHLPALAGGPPRRGRDPVRDDTQHHGDNGGSSPGRPFPAQELDQRR